MDTVIMMVVAVTLLRVEVVEVVVDISPVVEVPDVVVVVQVVDPPSLNWRILSKFSASQRHPLSFSNVTMVTEEDAEEEEDVVKVAAKEEEAVVVEGAAKDVEDAEVEVEEMTAVAPEVAQWRVQIRRVSPTVALMMITMIGVVRVGTTNAHRQRV